MTRLEVVRMVLYELDRAEKLHPHWPKDIVHAAAVVGEESGELTQASLDLYNGKGSGYDVIKEAIQTAAMGIRLVINFNGAGRNE